MPLRPGSHAAALALALALPGLAQAAASCTASTLPLVFANYSAWAVMPGDSTATVTLTCQSALGATVAYTIALSSGGGSFADRRMSAGGNALHYQLYTDFTRLSVWGDGVSAGTATVSDLLVVPSASVAASASKTVYGRIPAAQTSVPAAAYTDTITVTVTY